MSQKIFIVKSCLALATEGFVFSYYCVYPEHTHED